MKKKVLMSWSGGKDSAMALRDALSSGEFDVMALMTTVTEPYDRISMHGVRRSLLEQQARAIGLPLEIVLINAKETNEGYEQKIGGLLDTYKRAGATGVIFGDIFLEDLRRYREEKLAGAGMNGWFPLWRRNTQDLARAFLSEGFKGVVTCVDARYLGERYVGRLYDADFLRSLPETVDPCGENGEFHSFVYDGPLFSNEVKWRPAEKVLRDEFWFADLLPDLPKAANRNPESVSHERSS